MTTTNTNTVGTGGDYTTIAAWEADTDNNLLGDGAGSDSIEVGALLDEEHDAPGSITGATTDADHYRVLRATTGASYDPIAATGAAVVQEANANCVDIREEGFRCIGIAGILRGTGQATARACFLTFGDTTNANATPVLIDGCSAVVDGVANFAHRGYDLRAVSLLAQVVTRNCVALGTGAASSNIDIGWLLDSNSSHGVTAQNCVAYGCSTYGFSAPDNVATDSFTNCVAVANGAGDFAYAGGSSNITFASCASGDLSAIGTGAVTGIVAADAFTAPASNDFTLKTGSVLIDAGVDLSAFFTTDLAGNLHGRNGTWDIGAYDFRGYPLTRIAQTFSITDREEATMHFTNREEATCRIS